MTTTVEIFWDTHKKILIRDVHEKWHGWIRDFMYEKYFMPHRLFTQLEYQEDPLVREQYLKYVEHILKDECSIVALDDDTNKIYAVALVKCMTEEWHSWTALQLCIEQCKFSDVIELQYRMVNEYAQAYPDEPIDSLHLFEYYIDDELRSDTEFVAKFFNAIQETARHMKMPRVTFLAFSMEDQQECFEQGYERLSRAIYSIYTQRDIRPFAALRDIEEMEAGLFDLEVDPIIPYYEMKVRGIDDVEPPKQEQKKSSIVARGSKPSSMGSVDEAKND